MFKELIGPTIPLMDSLVRPLYVSGSDFIEALQTEYMPWAYVFLIIHKLADPWFIYFIVFPFMYYYSMRMGLRIVWAAAVTEFTCIILKLLVHGHRPYWYAMETLYHITAPKIEQIDGWTCETTPATPSDRTMVSACISYMLASHYCQCMGYNERCNWIRYTVIWGIHYVFQILVLLSSAFLATNFPHQAALGTAMGTLMASRLSKTNMLELTFKGYIWVLGVMLGTFFACYGGLYMFNYDPSWAASKASMTCIKIKWTDLYREALFIQAFRATGLVTGLGFSLRFFTTDKLKITDGCSIKVKLVHGFVGMLGVTLFDVFLHPPFGYSALLYYTFLLIKYTVPPLLIITEVPFLTGVSKLLICELVSRGSVKRYSATLGGDISISEETYLTDSVCIPSPLYQDECCISTSRGFDLCLPQTSPKPQSTTPKSQSTSPKPQSTSPKQIRRQRSKSKQRNY